MIKSKNGKVIVEGEIPEIMTDIAVVLITLFRNEKKRDKSFLYMCIIKAVLMAMEQA